MELKLAKILRVVSVPPVMATLLLSILYGVRPDMFGSLEVYLLSLLFLAVLPILAYPLQPLVPGFRGKKREGQRNLAILMSVIGYVSSLVYAFCAQVGDSLWLIYLTYFFSGFGLLIFNKVLKVRASGHACAIVGPVVALIYILGAVALFGLLVLGVVYWASLKTKSHTPSELFWGSAVTVLALGLSAGCIALF